MAYQQLMPEVLQVLENYSFEHDYGVSGYSLKLLLPALFDKRSPAYGLIKPRSLGKLLSAIMIDTGSADVTRTSSKEWKIAYSVPLVLRENSAIKEFLQNWVTQRLDQILDGGYELDQDQLSKIQRMADMSHKAVSDPSFYICDGYTPRYGNAICDKLLLEFTNGKNKIASIHNVNNLSKVEIFSLAGVLLDKITPVTFDPALTLALERQEEIIELLYKNSIRPLLQEIEKSREQWDEQRRRRKVNPVSGNPAPTRKVSVRKPVQVRKQTVTSQK